jgi:uncharacterized membrane protein YfcA
MRKLRTWKVVTLLAAGVVVFGFIGAFDLAARPNAVQSVFSALALLCLAGLLAVPGRAAYRSGRASRSRRTR